MNEGRDRPTESLLNIVRAQISFLLSSLSEDNFDRFQAEIRSLCEQHGPESYVGLLRRLLGTCYPRLGSDGGVVQRLLFQEIQRMGRDPFLADRLKDALERGEGEVFRTLDLHRLLERVPLRPLERLVLASVFVTSPRPEFASAAAQIIHADLENAVLALVARPSFDTVDMSLSQAAKLLAHLLSDTPPDAPVLDPSERVALLTAAQAKYGPDLAPVLRTVFPTLSLPPGTTLVQTLLQLGPDITSDHESVRALLARFGITDQNPPRDNQVVDIVSTLARYAAEGKALCDVGALVRALSSFPTPIHWATAVLAFDRLDRPGVDTATLKLLIAILLNSPRDVPDVPHAVTGFWAPWTNPLWQLRLLDALLSLPNDTFNFVSLPGRRIVTVDDVAGASPTIKALAANVQSHTWNELMLIETLTRLGDEGAPEVQAYVREMMDKAVKISAELVYMGLLQVSKPWNRTQQEYSSKLLTMFLNGHPNHQLVFMRIWQIEPTYLTKAFGEYYADNALNITRVLDVAQDLKILDSLLDVRPFDFALDVAALASRREYLNLDKWLADNITTHGAEFVHAVIEFLESKVKGEIARNASGSDQPPESRTMPLNPQTIAIFIRVLKNSGTGLTPEDAEYFIEIRNQCLQLHPRLMNLTPGSDAEPGVAVVSFSPEVEQEVENIYKEMYEDKISIDQMVSLLQRSKVSSNPRDHEVFACTLHTLFDEYRFFARYYPARELQMTGYLFGSLVKYQLVDYIPLGIAIRYVLDAVRAPPDSNMFTFGVNALTQFKNRLWEWKPLCHALLGIPHLAEVRPDLVEAARKGLAAEGPEPEEQDKEASELEVMAFTALRPDSLSESDALVEPAEDVSDKIMFIVNNLAPSNFDAKLEEMRGKFGVEHSRWFARYLVEQRVSLEANNQGLYMRLLDGLVQNSDEDKGNPDSALERAPLGRYVLHETYVKAAQLLNAEKTISSSSERRVLKNLASWLGQLTLARNKPILHRNLSFKDLLLEGFDTDRLIVAIPFVCAILEQCSRSRIFQPPNPWLMAVLALLAEFYHFAELKLNLKFEIEVLCKALDIDLDKVEAAGILRARVAAQGMGTESGLPDFVQEGDAFGFEHPSSSGAPAPSQGQAGDTVQTLGGAGGGMTAQIEAIVANLGAMVVVSPAVGYANHPGFKRAVQVAIEGAVREIILPVVDRSVTIASISTKELVAKDYALEADEIKIRKAAQQMVQNLAGSLALVTCKEPLKNNMALHMRQVLTEVGFSELMVPEQIILRVVSDNVDMACTAIERAAMDRAVTVIDEAFAASYELRRRHSETRPNQPFWDPTMPVMHYQQSLPDPLRIKPTGLVNSQTRVYDDFSQPRRVEQKRVLMPRTVSYNRQDMMGGPSANPGPGSFSNPSPAPSNQSQGPGPAMGMQAPPMTQAVMPERVMERFVSLINELESLFLMTPAQQGGEALQSSQEIRMYIRQVLYLAQQSSDREETALAFSQKIVQLLYKSTTPLAREVYVVILGRLCEQSTKVAKEATDWLLYAEDDRKLNVPVTTTLLQSRLIGLREQDQQLAKLIQRDMRPNVMEFTAKLIRECTSGEHAFATRSDFPHCLDALSRAAQAGKAPEDAMGLLDDLQGVARGAHSGTSTRASSTYSNTQLVLLSERLAVHFDDWVRIFQRSPSSEKAFASYVMQLTNEGILKGEDISSFFFRVCTETSVEQWTKYTAAGDYGAAYQPIDALSRLIVLMIKYNGDATDLPAKVHYLTKILSIVVLVLAHAHEASVEFPQQKPFFRFFSSLLNDINGLESHLPFFPLLVAICDTFNTLQPINFPGFAFSWMTLISHRLFMPKMLSSENREGWRPYHRLLISLFRFLEPFLRSGELQNPTRTLLHGSLRLLMVILHDFPEFLSEFYFSLCDMIPARCIQLRNIILSAYPPTLRLPDPHRETQLETLSDMGPIPPVLSDFTLGLRHGDMRAALDQCLLGRGSSALVTSLKESLAVQSPGPNAPTGEHYNLQALNALVMYVGVSSVAQAKARSGSHVFVPTDPGVTLLTHLANELDTEGTYHLLVSMVTHLRYPNAHTHWFSSLVLHMFVEGKNSRLQEIATRVLLERLMVFRPHPWGALVTFIELLRNPRYDFWNKDFVRVAPEISMLLDRPGVDDVIALLLLLASNEAELALITVTFGNTELQHAYTNILKVYQLVLDHLERFPDDRSRFPNFKSKPKLCRGAAGPLSGIPHLAKYFHGPDGLSDISTTHPEFNVRNSSALSEVVQEYSVPAEDAIIELLLENPEDSVTIIAVGPLTNIAQVWLKNPQALQRARRIVVMGGTLDAPGNTSATAEFNFFADPKAASIIMDAAKSESIDLFLAPLDLTTQHGIPYTHLMHPKLLSGSLVNGPELAQIMSPLRAFTSAFLHRVRRVTRELGLPDVFDMHDPLAVWAGLVHAALPRGAPLVKGWGAERRDFVIECEGQYTKGMCVVDRRGGTDKTGGVRTVDGVQGVDKAKSKPTVGVKVLTFTPGLAVMEKLMVEKLFWDLRQPN